MLAINVRGVQYGTVGVTAIGSGSLIGRVHFELMHC